MPSASSAESSAPEYGSAQQLDAFFDFGSKALNGLVSNMAAPTHDASGGEPRASPLASIASMLTGGGEGGMCFKTCGMEDIQFAAVKAGELFISLRFCALVLTVITVCCMLVLTTVLVFHLLRNRVRVDASQHLLDRTLSLFGGREQKPPPPLPKDIGDSAKSTV
ncbi:hypothetical protein QR680_017232 [Steinernema hermaphroditum]|uniref:Transmembrane protein n=1 Tax=Steinernema hermaphroditum TaxID=289476 RepID=A0AA39LNS4_9BILA|nr:hypothetical protein QR680_017232 [Steinernema hermaphroditum]